MKYPKWLRSASRLVNQQRSLWTDPYRIAYRLEEISPWLARRYLSISSNWISPHRLGMGLTIENNSDTHTQIHLPSSWKNLDQYGRIHAGALVTVAEHCLFTFWDRHIDPAFSALELVEMKFEFFKQPFTDIYATLQMSEAEVEAILYRLRNQGKTVEDIEVKLYSSTKLLVANIHFKLRLLSVKALPLGPDQSNTEKNSEP